MAIDAVFKRVELEQVVNVEGKGLGDFAFDLDGPGTRGQGAGVFRGVALVDAELVEVVVMRNVVEGGELLAGGGERALNRLELGFGVDGGAWRDDLGHAIDAENCGADCCGAF